VPTLAEAILHGVQDKTYTGAPLKGIAVGNGCSGTDVGICSSGPQSTVYEWEYLLQTAFVSNALKAQVNEACDWVAAKKNQKGAISAKCVSLLNQASSQIQNINLYGIYADCISGGCAGEELRAPRGKVPMREELVVVEESPNGESTTRKLARIIPNGPDACINSITASAYFNQPSVQEAIHVQAPKECWSVCATAPGWSYNSTRTNLPANTYPFLVSNINVLIYNGVTNTTHTHTRTHIQVSYTSVYNLYKHTNTHTHTQTNDTTHT